MRIFRSGSISDEFAKALKQAGIGQPDQPVVPPAVPNPAVPPPQEAPQDEEEEPESPPPPEAGVPFVRPSNPGLDDVEMTLELPFDYLEWGMLVDKKYVNGPGDEFDATVYYDPREEAYQEGDFFSEHIEGGFSPAIYHIVVRGRDVIKDLPPELVKQIEEKLAEDLNVPPEYDPPDPDYY